MAVLFAAMVAWSAWQWHLWGQAWDFASFNQPAWLIVHGHLDPVLTVSNGRHFLQDHFSLFFYPLSLVYALHQSGFTLLFLQDLAAAGAVLVLARWVLEMAAHHGRQPSAVLSPPYLWSLLVGVLLVASLNPWLWQTISFDFHMAAFMVLFLVLAARAFWNSRPIPAIVWCALCLTCLDYAALVVAGLGVSVLLAGRGIRRWGLLAIAMGCAWMGIVSLAGGNQGDHVVAYGYLIGPGAAAGVTLPRIAVAMAAHPSRWLSMLATKPLDLYRVLVPTGLLSLASPWSLPVILAVVLPAALLPPPIFLESGFQVFAAEIIGLAGAVFVLVWVASRLGRRFGLRWGRLLFTVLAAAVLIQSLAVSAVLLPRIPKFWLRVSATQAAGLASAQHVIPPDAELVISMPVMGHFSGRQWVWPVVTPGQRYPIRTRTVDILIAPSAGNITMPPTLSKEAITDVERLGATEVFRRDGVTVLRWHPIRSEHSFTVLP